MNDRIEICFICDREMVKLDTLGRCCDFSFFWCRACGSAALVDDEHEISMRYKPDLVDLSRSMVKTIERELKMCGVIFVCPVYENFKGCINETTIDPD